MSACVSRLYSTRRPKHYSLVNSDYYYFITTVHPGIKLWWKKYLTTLQISQVCFSATYVCVGAALKSFVDVQFVIDVSHLKTRYVTLMLNLLLTLHSFL